MGGGAAGHSAVSSERLSTERSSRAQRATIRMPAAYGTGRLSSAPRPGGSSRHVSCRLRQATNSDRGSTQLIEWMGTDLPGITPVVRAAMAHYQFETLHPFSDGNGRLGRLLIVASIDARPGVARSVARRLAVVRGAAGGVSRNGLLATERHWRLGHVDRLLRIRRRSLCRCDARDDRVAPDMERGSCAPRPSRGRFGSRGATGPRTHRNADPLRAERRPNAWRHATGRHARPAASRGTGTRHASRRRNAPRSLRSHGRDPDPPAVIARPAGVELCVPRLYPEGPVPREPPSVSESSYWLSTCVAGSGRARFPRPSALFSGGCNRFDRGARSAAGVRDDGCCSGTGSRDA